MYANNGRILRINLSKKELKIEDISEKLLRKYLGGKSLALYYLLKEMNPRSDPFGPENPLIFSTGTATGVPLPGFSRFSVLGKSPLTGGFGEAEAGGYWGAELKYSGFDLVSVAGISEKPVYLWICDNDAELRDASSIWGLKTKEAQEAIRKDTGESLARVALIGPAGERLVRYACIINDLKFANGRSGLGAVMGSKKLKAVAVKGRRKPEYKDQDKLKELAKWFSENWKNHPPAVSRSRFGTAEMVLPLNADGTLPTRNFIKGSFDHAEEISGEAMAKTILVETEGCYACPIRCKRVVKGRPPFETDPSYGGPEYETVAAFGSLCEVADLSAISLANQLCNAYGMDTISTGCAIAYAMECYENGILTLKDTDSLDLKFGNAEAMVKMVEMIAERRGIGNLLAEGVRIASEKFNGSERYALHVKGKEIPMHEPRGKTGVALQYAFSASGADHMQAAHDPPFEKNIEGIMPLGIHETVNRLSLGPEKVQLFKTLHLWWNLLDCLDVCKFVIKPHSVGVFNVNHIMEVVNAATGWDTSLHELMTASERALNMSRLLNIREGFTEHDDTLPRRFFEPLESGPRAGAKISEEEFAKSVKIFYEMMGWDERGIPKLSKLHELGLSEFI
ncbi:aldehyde ferredoxin oxidoreductase family protein [Candidatus Bathyarchaeota archaeon]|nr:aldehyde ferredoxin oxidoreductase family protein [Candidatus Bathyarchaeota archaeon]MBS7630725.1 aldehyde ferredoxin oxidoreductase family protein [Candidatus Bathyarchaeota archaeon]